MDKEIGQAILDELHQLRDDDGDNGLRIIWLIRLVAKESDTQFSYIDLIKIFKTDFNIKYDAYGHTMQYLFAVAGEMNRRDLCVPDEWDYRPGLGGGIDPDCPVSYEMAEASDEALKEFGSYLFKIYNYCKENNLDY